MYGVQLLNLKREYGTLIKQGTYNHVVKLPIPFLHNNVFTQHCIQSVINESEL